MKLATEQLPDDINALKEMINTLTLQSSKYADTIKSKENTIKYLEEQLKLVTAKLFGRKSEKLTPEDSLQGRLFNEAGIHFEKKKITEEETVIVKEHKRVKPVRKPLPDYLPRVEVIYDIPAEEKSCACGCELTHISDEVSEKLDIIPMQARVIKQIRRKYACKKCEGASEEHEGNAVKLAPLPPQIIPKGIATSGLLAYIFTSKFCDALPFYRLEKIFDRIGIELPRSTMCSWPIDIYDRYSIFFDIFWKTLPAYPLLGIDETTVQVMNEPGKKNTTKSYMWIFRGTGQDRPVILFHYASSRSGSEIEKYLREYKGFIQTDGYAGYNIFALQKNITHAGCWAHVRRNFYDSAKHAGDNTFANTVVSIIRMLYAVEKDASEDKLTFDKIRILREEKSRPIIDSLKKLLDDKVHHIAPKSLTGKAIRYALERWDSLTVYLTDGRIPIDNNLVENAIRPFVVGRKNWLFSGSPQGAKASAAIYSLIETAKANGIEPYWYMRYLFEKLPYAKTTDEFRELLPNVVDPVIVDEFRRGAVR